jgi:hypothetical protein
MYFLEGLKFGFKGSKSELSNRSPVKVRQPLTPINSIDQ